MSTANLVMAERHLSLVFARLDEQQRRRVARVAGLLGLLSGLIPKRVIRRAQDVVGLLGVGSMAAQLVRPASDLPGQVPPIPTQCGGHA